MSILVTGGAGYIGSHMLLCLVDHNEKVVVLDDLSTGRRDLVHADTHFIEGNAGDEVLVNQIIQEYRITDILHFAGSIVVPESIVDPQKYYWNNTCVSANLISTAARAGVKNFIFSSTAAVYAEPKTDVVKETDPLGPSTPYGRSKLMTETMLKDISQATGLTYGVLRYFNVAGADPKGRSGHCNPDATHLIKMTCATALGRRDAVDVFGTDYPTRDGSGIRDYIHVSDLASAHLYLLHDLRTNGENVTINCGYGRGVTVLEVIEAIRQISQIDFKVRHKPRRTGDLAAIVADPTLLKDRTGWAPEHEDLFKIVEGAFRWDKQLLERI